MSLRLSILIAAWNSREALRVCLQSLREQAQANDTEIIVVNNFERDSLQTLQSEFPFVNFITLPPETTVPVLRSAGIAKAQGEIVVLIEDQCTVSSHWCAAIKQAHNLSYSVVGGPIENASPDRAVNWAVYFFDYGAYMLPIQAGEIGSLSGMNASYKKTALGEVQDSFRDGFFEASVHDALRRAGHAFYLAPEAIVFLCKDHLLGRTLIQFFHLARSFAARRFLNPPPVKRCVYGAGALLLPFALPLRVVTKIARKQRQVWELLKAVPALLSLTTSWSAGEFCGYLWGEGPSAKAWK